MAGIHFDITGENRNFLQALRGSEQGVKQTANAMEQYGSQIESMFSRIKTAAELSLAGFTVKGFAEKVAMVRGEFQQLEVAFETMLGSADKARTMMDDMTRLAATTPFDLQGVANGAKQLLAYGMEANQITDTLRRLGDVAAGLGIQLGDLTYLYGTTMAQGRMYTQDLNQFTGRGIPMIRELAKQFGVAESKVKDLVTEGKVGFPEVQKVIESLTNKGGQFGGLMEAQSHTIVGQISNIEDSIDMMFNEMGKSSEGAINTVLDGVGFAIDHYKEFGSVILGVVASYGEWKAAAMIVNSWHNMLLNQAKDIESARQAELSAIADQFKDTDDTASTQASTIAEEQNTIARNANKSAIDAEIAAIEMALKAKLAEAEANYNNATSKAASASIAVDAANEAVDAAEEQYEAILKTGNAEAIEAAEMELNTAVAEANSAQKSLLAAREEVATAATAKNTAATKLNTLQTQVDSVQKKANATATGIWAAVTKSATTAVRGLTAAIAANPIGALLVGLTTVLSMIPMFTSETAEASAEVTRFGEAAVKQTNNVETLFAVVESTSDKSKVHKESVDELIKVYEEYGIHIDKEADQLQQLIDKHDELIKKIREEGEERQKANLLASYEEGMSKALEDMRTQWNEAFKNAEYDGSGLIDDWDATPFQEAADQIGLVANAIAQSEFDKLQQIVEDGGTVTEEQIRETINNVKSKVEAEAQKLTGASLYTSSYDEVGNEIKHYIDIDYDGIMEGYADKVLKLADARRDLIATIKDTKKETDDEAESVDYASMEFAELIDKAYGAKDAVESVGNTDGTPTVDTTPLDNATTSANTATSAVNTLGSTTATPFVNTSYITNAIAQTGTLINSLNMLSTGGVQGFKFNTNGFGLKVNSPKLGFNYGTSFFNYNPLATNPNAGAYAEIQNRVNGAKNDKQVKDLLKDINDALETADYGSTQRSELLALKKKLEDRKKKNNPSSTSSKKGKSSSGKTTAEKVEDEKERLADMEDEVALQRIRKAQDLQDRLTNVRLEGEGNTASALLRKRQQTNKEEIQSIERERDDAIKAYIESEKKIFEQREKIKKTQNSKYKEQKFDESSVDTSTIKNQYDEIIQLTQEKQQKDIIKEEADALNEYLKEYGTYEQKKLAITQEYEEKIKAVTTTGERMTLERQMESALGELDMEQFKKSINWEVVFNDLDRISVERLRALKEQLKKALSTKDISADNAKVIAEQIDKINDSISSKQKEWRKAFGLVIPELEKQRELEQKALDAQEKVIEAEKKQAEALREVEEIRKRIIALAKQEGVTIDSNNVTTSSQGDITQAFQSMDKNTSELTDMFSKLGKAEGNAAQATEGLAGAQMEAGAAAEGAAGSAAGTVAIIDTIIHKINENVQSANELFNQMGLSDTKFGKGFSNFAKSSQYATEGWEALKSGNVMGVANAVYGSLRTLGDALGEWGIGFMGASDTSLPDDIERLTESNKDLEKAVSNLAEKMEDSAVVDAKSVYEKQKQDVNQSIANTKELMQRSGAAYSNGFLGIGGKHSSDYQINKGISSSEWSRISNLLGKSVRSAGDFFNLTSEEMYKVQTELTDIYSHIKDLANDGYADAAQFMDDYCEYWKTLQELEEAYFEKLTSVTFDSVQDEFSNLLQDMDSDTEDFAESFEKYMQQAIINSLVSEKYKPLLEKWYSAFASYMADGAISDAEMAALRGGGTFTDLTTGLTEAFTGWDSISESAIQARDTLKDVFGWDSNYSQKASDKSWGAMSQETAEELNGRFTAVQINTQDTAERMLSVVNLLGSIQSAQTSDSATLMEIRNMMIYTNSYLEDMVKYAKLTYENFGTKLDDVVTNTKNL